MHADLPGEVPESPACGGGAPLRERVVTARGAWMQAASCGVISFFTLSRSMGKIFCTKGIQLLLEEQRRILRLHLGGGGKLSFRELAQLESSAQSCCSLKGF